MKKNIFILCAAIFAVMTSFKMALDKSAAVSETVNGVQVFAFSKPANSYDVLGQVKIKGIVASDKAGHMVNLLTEKAKKDYPSAQGIILNADIDKAEAIKFKE